MQSFFVQKKTVIIEGLVLVLFLGGMYYLYTMFSEETATTTTTTINQQLLGQNFVLFLKAVNEDKISFSGINFMDSALVAQLRDYSQTIGINDSRGRVDPYSPYASSRSIR
ncbi:MAG: hypothetical protein ACAH17_01565 [Candidatus Paceibacterota bacterium]